MLETVIGLMSGTSMDGVDVALLETDGLEVANPLAFYCLPYTPEFRARLVSVMGGKGDVAGVEAELTDLHANAVVALLAETKAQPTLVGFHGQTILHAPHEGRTWQIGDGARLARHLGIPVVNDFRTKDVEAGGQGAPLVPLYHAARAAKLERPLMVLNIGGVANLTFMGSNGQIIACDTGPGNARIDDWMLRHTGVALDLSGKTASQGRVNEDLVAELLSQPYFSQPYPKSLDRADFPVTMLEGRTLADGAATLAAFTSGAVAKALPLLPERPRRILVTGGGRKNRFLMQRLAADTQLPVEAVEAVGWQGDALEAEAFAYLAKRSCLGLPFSLPTTTGVKAPMSGGVLHKP